MHVETPFVFPVCLVTRYIGAPLSGSFLEGGGDTSQVCIYEYVCMYVYVNRKMDVKFHRFCVCCCIVKVNVTSLV